MSETNGDTTIRPGPSGTADADEANPFDPAWSERFVPVHRPPVLDGLMGKLIELTGRTGSRVTWQGSAEADSISLAVIAYSLARLAGWSEPPGEGH